MATRTLHQIQKLPSRTPQPDDLPVASLYRRPSGRIGLRPDLRLEHLHQHGGRRSQLPGGQLPFRTPRRQTSPEDAALRRDDAGRRRLALYLLPELVAAGAGGLVPVHVVDSHRESDFGERGDRVVPDVGERDGSVPDAVGGKSGGYL